MYPGAHVAEHADKIAVLLAETGESLTYGQLEERSVRLAHVLHDRGLRPGDGVALLARNGPRFSEVHWAALRSGLYLTALDVHLAADELAYILADCGARLLVVDAGLGEVALALAAAQSDVEVRLVFDGELEGHEDYESALAAASAVPFADQPVGLDMQYSSGTTGSPKGVRAVLPERQVDEPGDPLVAVFAPMYGFDAETVYLSPAPMYHAAPLRFCAIVQAMGGTVVMMRRFEAEEALRLVERHAVTHSQWVPTMFVRMLKLPDAVRRRHDVSSLRVAVHAAAPCPVEVKQAMMDWWGPVLHEYYAATEAAGVTLIGPQEWLSHPGSVGRSGLGVLRICDEDDPDQPELPIGSTGLIYFERVQMPFAYHRDEAKTRAAQHPHHDSWATTGDIGHVDAEGYLYLTDRKAFMIISGGVNIYPQEIENTLALHPSVLDVAVIGVPDPEMGEQVKAVVQLPPGVEGTPALAEELIAHVRQTIAHFKVPRSVDFVDDLPRTPTGKLLKRRLVEAYRSGA